MCLDFWWLVYKIRFIILSKEYTEIDYYIGSFSMKKNINLKSGIWNIFDVGITVLKKSHYSITQENLDYILDLPLQKDDKFSIYMDSHMSMECRPLVVSEKNISIHVQA